MSRRSERTSVESALETKKEQIRNYFLRYTRQAFRILPRIKEPHILDVGCGSGNPTIELAKLSDGRVTGIDIDQNSLDRLNAKIQKEGLSNRVFTKKCSLLNIDFPDETFDIIWAEGSIHIVGFEKGLKELRRLLRQDGFLVVHDGVKDISDKLKKTPDLGYTLINHFRLPDDAWWVHYFEPLERLIKEQHMKDKTNENLSIIARYQTEVNMYKMNPKENISAFYMFQKK
ncbi:MAG: class I SAM-dependent methyltransferase [Candidatus Bathyarchaeota archaeon]|jgi:ubiquinone/menaquinone biosynthesis C-methylase UbiE